MGARPRKPVTTPETRERRVGVRVAVDTYIRVAVVHAATGRKVHGWVRDLSQGGLFVEGPDRFEADDAVIVDALARSGENAVHLRAEGWVAYIGRGGMGIQLGPLDPEMAGRLAELIERFG
jgi:hypothetical protein